MNDRRRAQLASKYQTDGMKGATPARLLLAVFDQLRRDLEAARLSIGTGQTEKTHRRLVNAQDLVFELQLALDSNVWPGAAALGEVYRHLMSILIEANLHKSAALVEGALDIVVPLENSWKAAHNELQQTSAAPGITRSEA